MVLGIAPVAIIDRQLPFEYTITSRSGDVMVMALPVQNINHSAYSNVLAKWNAVYDAHNEVGCLMLGSLTPELHRQFKNYSLYEMLQELKSMFEKQEDLSVGLIMNGLTSDFAGFVRNYNMHNMGKTISELHALLIEHEKCLSKKAETPQGMAIRSGKIHKANKKLLNAKGKGKRKGKGKDKSYTRKMTRKPFPHHTERETDLLGILHIDVCGPLRHVSRQEVEGFEPSQEEVIQICRSESTHQVPNRLCLNVEAEEHSLGDLNEPTSYKDVMLDLKSKKWLDAMNAEIQSMIDNMVWVLVDLPPNCKIVGSKWIYKRKTDMDGIVHTYKARLVGKGYTQTFMVDYEETFSPVPNIRAIRILISIEAFYDYEIWQIYIKTVFLNGYRDPKHPKKIYRDRSKRLIGLGQNAYMDKILKRYKMDNSKRGHIPMQERLNLNKTQGASTPKEVKRMQNVPYALAMGSIMYSVRCTRTDVAFAQNITSRFQHNPGKPYWTAVKNILKYLRNTKDMFWFMVEILKLNFELIAIANLRPIEMK
uniref:Integrase core domain, putative n=1 Tax=Tanacetum cinerariifolium TaxID=118510 RepID=A0A6L2KZE8_TANCI|nr:integrase core domain, putative [Tanacetum cinerariifolium]